MTAAKLEKQRKALLAALDAAVITLSEIAEAADLSEDSLYFYRLGIRRPRPQTIKTLTKILEGHYRRLSRAMERLHDVAR